MIDVCRVMAGLISDKASLQARVARSHTISSTLNVPFLPQRPPTYRQYNSVSMEKAYEAVVTGKMSVHKASDENGIPRSTLHDKVSKKVPLKTLSGVKVHLTI